MIGTYIQMHRTDKNSQHSSIICPVWLNGWVFVYELSICGFQSRCCDIVCSYFSGNLLLPFLLGFDFKTLIKSRGRGSSVNIYMNHFFLTWFIWKLAEKNKIYIIFESFFFKTSYSILESWSRSINSQYRPTRLG